MVREIGQFPISSTTAGQTIDSTRHPVYRCIGVRPVGVPSSIHSRRKANLASNVQGRRRLGRHTVRRIAIKMAALERRLASIRIPRGYRPDKFGKVVRYELHHFSDASSTGYGQCSYLRLINEKGNVHCALVMGKARVTPLRVVTIPRLELQAAIVSVKVSKFLRQELEYKEISEYFWTDSRVVLGYIGNDAKRFHVYVANRVQKIRDATEPQQWHYVSSENNPADHASRGIDAKGLLSSNWFNGPSFLWERELPDELTHLGEQFVLSTSVLLYHALCNKCY